MAPKPNPEAPTELIRAADPRAPGLRVVAMWEGGAVTIDLPAVGALTIGRGAEADIRIDHASVSRRHARLVLGESMSLEDLGSSNGVTLSGRRLPANGSATVNPGDMIELGTTLMVVHRRGAADEARVAGAAGDPAIIVADPEMERIYQLLELVAKSNLSVLLLGETGVGKEVFASYVHRASPRAAGPFLKVNCAAFVESLLEGELFGHERGAFTGAHQAKVGLLEGAHKGTLFLDEVGELPPTVQAKLLRVFESGEVTRIGSLTPRKVDVRFVAATNRDLRSIVAAGAFREDLFFRLEGISVRIPPLRERTKEIPALAAAMVSEACASAGRPPIRLAEDAVAHLALQSWPGNIRELKNVIRRSVLLCPRDVLAAADIRIESDSSATELPSSTQLASSSPAPTAIAAQPPAAGTPPTKKALERERILNALTVCGGNQTRAAKMLGISRRTLVHKLDLLDVPRPRKKDDE